MNYHVLTLFPEMIEAAFATSITGRAMEKGLLSLDAVNIRDFAEEKRKGRVDDYSYGGGAGMIMQAEPVFLAAMSVLEPLLKQGKKPRVLYMSPMGKPFSQKMAEELAGEQDLVFLCGHYEGIDQRVIDEVVTDQVSLGDFVLTGGELAALVMMDAISRMVPGVLSNDESARTESFMGEGLLEYPQYSRPEIWHDRKVPDVLMSGNHGAVDRWRRDMSLRLTAQRRPDLCSGAVLDKKDLKFIRQAGLEEAYKDAKVRPKKGKNMIRNIVYDVGYVLVGYSWREKFLDFGYDEEGVRRLADKLFSSRDPESIRPFWEKYDMNEVTDREMEDYCFSHFPEDKEALTWFFKDPSVWCVYLEDIADTVKVMKEKGYHTYLLSNYPERLWKCHIGQAPFTGYLDGQTVSWEEGIGKPDERFYKVLLDRYQLKAEECLFLDDRKANTDAAAKLGFQTMTLDSPKKRAQAAGYLRSLPKL